MTEKFTPKTQGLNEMPLTWKELRELKSDVLEARITALIDEVVVYLRSTMLDEYDVVADGEGGVDMKELLDKSIEICLQIYIELLNQNMTQGFARSVLRESIDRIASEKSKEDTSWILTSQLLGRIHHLSLNNPTADPNIFY